MFDSIMSNWKEIGIVVIAIHTAMKAVRRAIDTTPETDDNVFEKVVTIIGKIVGYAFGKDMSVTGIEKPTVPTIKKPTVN